MVGTRVARTAQLKGWSVSGELLPGADDESVVLQAQFQHIGYYTVQFQLDIPPGAVGEAGSIYCLADITWTVEGNSITRRVSLGNGTTVSGMGQSVNVEIFDFSQPGGGARYRVTANLAPGARPTSGSNPQLAINSWIVPVEDRRGATLPQVVTPGGIITFDIPQNVGVNSVFIFAAPVNAVANSKVATEDFLNVTYNISFQARLQYALNRWIPVPPAAVQLLAALNAAFPDPTGMDISPIWGIEG